MTAKRGKKSPAKKIASKKTPEPVPAPVKKEPKVKLEAPVLAASAKAALPPPPKVEKPVEPTPAPAIEKPAPAPATKVRDPELPPLPPPLPNPPVNPDTIPFDHKGKRPDSRPCHRCLKQTKLTTNVVEVEQNYTPKSPDEGMFHEMFGTLIVNVICAPCWSTGWGSSW